MPNSDSPQSILDIVLVEIRSLRSDFQEHARATGERLAALETSMHVITGNGQKGRLQIAEEKISRLERWKWQLTGMGITIGCIAGYVARVAFVH